MLKIPHGVLRLITGKAKVPLVWLIATLVFTACSNSVESALVTTEETQQSLSTPTTNQCWNATPQQAQDWISWQGGPAVDCYQPHQLGTHAVVEVYGFEIADDADADITLKDFRTRGAEMCAQQSTHLDAYRIYRYLFFPTFEELKSGARWARCDFAIAAVGSKPASVVHESMTGKPLDLLGEWYGRNGSNDRSMLLCYKATTGRALDEGDREIVDCNQKITRWQVSFQNFPYGGDYIYDTDDGKRPIFAECNKIEPPGALRKKTRVTFPDKDTFLKRLGYPRCWFYIPS